MKKLLPYILGALFLGAGIYGLSGCDFGDIVRVKTPTSLQEEGLPASMSLNDAEVAYDLWVIETQYEDRVWRESIGKAQTTKQTISGIVWGYEGEWTRILGAASPLAALLLGVVLPRPGEEKRVRTEKEASYNKGIEIGRNETRA